MFVLVIKIIDRRFRCFSRYNQRFSAIYKKNMVNSGARPTKKNPCRDWGGGAGGVSPEACSLKKGCVYSPATSRCELDKKYTVYKN